MNLGRGAYRAGRWAWRRRALWGVLLGALGAALGFFGSGPASLRLAAGAGLLVLLVDRTRARLCPGDRSADLELGMLLVACAYAALEMLGGSRTPAHAVIYAIVAFGVATQGLWVGVAMVALASIVEWRLAPALLPWRVAMLALFALGAAALLRGEIARQRREQRQRVEKAIRTLREDARDFRLVASALSAESRWRNREDEVDKLAQGSAETVHDSLYHLLELLKRSLGLQTCALLWIGEDSERMKIKELVSDSDLVGDESVPAAAGVLGAIVKNRAPLHLAKPDASALPYYRGPERVGAFFGVPLIEGQHVRGVLCADRADQRPLSPDEEALLGKAAGQILRVVHSERVFAAIERSKYEHERFYRASEMLRGALTLDQVYDTALRAAREIVEFDFAGITLFDRETRRHRIVRVWDPERMTGEDLEGLEYADNAGLAAMAVKNKHFLPTTGGPGERVVFTRKIRLRMESLLVLPLIAKGDQAIGTFTLASKRPERFGGDVREMLGVIVNQVAVSIDNAKMYQRLQELATTDGLTGLCNRRSFQERLDEALVRAARRHSRVSVVMADVDHFKKINDTYGHPVGDVVLRRVSQILAAAVRNVDVVARYGGEEFALVLPESNLETALFVGEKLRKLVEEHEFVFEQKRMPVTFSGGVAEMKKEHDNPLAFLKTADEQLYAAKKAGRNRVQG